MLGRKRDQYLGLRRRFTPERIDLIIVAESPPASGLYFYDPDGSVGEPLFAALMKHLGLSPDKKEIGLRGFQRSGWLLVDATYEPVNTLDNSMRDQVIARDYPLLRNDLKSLMRGRSIPLVLIKANVCRILEPRLLGDGFIVMNRGRPIYFPSNGRQTEFHRELRAVLAFPSDTLLPQD